MQPNRQLTMQGAIIGFKTQRGEQVHARIASYFISFEQAARNMKELGNDNLEQIKQRDRKHGTKYWEKSKWKEETSINTALSTPAYTVRYFSPKIL